MKSQVFRRRDNLEVLPIRNVPTGNDSFSLVTEPGKISEGLASAWKPIFSKKSIDLEKAKAYANRFKGNWNWSLLERPSKDTIQNTMKRLPDSASGPDGLPYAAWQNAGDEGVETLWQTTEAQCAGERPPINYNDSATIFVPKGELENDHVQIVREAEDNRPLTLKNVDGKIGAAAVNSITIPLIKDGAHKSQNGFVKGRQLLQNVVDSDTLARIFGMQADSFNHQNQSDRKGWSPCGVGHSGDGQDQNIRLAIVAFFDFAAAFPSVAHEWIFIVFQAAGAPTCHINYISALYSNNNTYHMNSHGKVFLFAFLSGVLQGCPKCAPLFLFAINPFLIHFEEALKGHYFGEVRACADDLGICFKDFRGLRIAHLVFACA